jgi:hypothetical protein
MARGQMTLSEAYSKGTRPVPEFLEYINKVRFAPPPPPDCQFAKARPNRYNPGAVIPFPGSPPSVQFNMHVNNNLYAAAGNEHMKWAMRCSIAGIQGILGENEPHLRSCQPDTKKFFLSAVSYTRRQLGYRTDTRTMQVGIPDDKRKKILENLVNNWGSSSWKYSFILSNAAEVLGVFIYLCRVYPWGIFLFHTLYNAMSQALAKTAARLWNSPEFHDVITLRKNYSQHPTQSSGGSHHLRHQVPNLPHIGHQMGS